MARPGIAYQDVVNAAEQLSAKGEYISIDRIRSLTKTGSNSTIAKHLKNWREHQDTIDSLHVKEKLPEPLVRSLCGLWENVMSQADARVTAAKESLEDTLAELRGELKQTQEAKDKFTQENQTITYERDALRHDKAGLEQVIREFEDKAIAQKVSDDKLKQQLTDKQERIEELSRLNKQIQVNLEHYREASREHRLTEQQRYEQKERVLDEELQKIRHNFLSLREKYEELIKTNDVLHKEKIILENSHQLLENKNETLRAKLTQLEKIVGNYEKSEVHWKQESHHWQSEAINHNQKREQLQTEVAVISQKLTRAEADIEKLTEQNNHLAREKWSLGQEKAQLLGQLKHHDASTQ